MTEYTPLPLLDIIFVTNHISLRFVPGINQLPVSLC